MKYDYPTAFSLWGSEEHAAVERVLASGQLTMAGEVAAFEAEYAAYHGRKHCVMANSGSSANLLAVAALLHMSGYKREADPRTWRAAVPGIAWSTTYAPIYQQNGDFILLDVDETWNAPDPSRWGGASARLLNSSIVVGCSILGNPGYLKEWADWAEQRDCWFLNDDCESLGATIDGRTTASFGDVATSSFFHSHQLSAIEGGAVLTDDPECYCLLKMLRAHGWTRDIKKPETFADEYDFQLFGYNLRPLELHAAIAREQLKKLSGFIIHRRVNSDYFTVLAQAARLPISTPAYGGGDRRPSPFGLQFTVESSDVRQRLVTALRAASIDCRLPTGGSFRLHKYGAPWRDQQTPHADHIHTHGLFLGNAPYDIADKIERAVQVMREVL